MKQFFVRVICLLAALMLFSVFAFHALAASVPADTTSSGDDSALASSETTSSGEALQDGFVQEDDTILDLNLAATLIVVICSVLTVGVIVTVVLLARRNR